VLLTILETTFYTFNPTLLNTSNYNPPTKRTHTHPISVKSETI